MDDRGTVQELERLHSPGKRRRRKNQPACRRSVRWKLQPDFFGRSIL